MIRLKPLPAPPTRRDGEVHAFEFDQIGFAVTINFDLQTNRAFEFFLSSRKPGSLIDAMLSDGCISISKHIEDGKTLPELAEMFGANRAEGMALKDAPPSSPFGLIVRRAMEREQELKGEQS